MRYICDEAQNKLSETWKTSDWTVSAPKDIPKQLNGCDCGVFMLKYADWVVRFPALVACLASWLPDDAGSAPQARNAALRFTQADMPYFRKRIIAEIVAKQA